MSRLAVALVLSAVACAQVSAQEGSVPARLSLDEAVRIAEARSPRLSAARAEIAIADAEVSGARTRPNPSLTVESQGYPIGQSPRPPFFDTQEFTVRAEQEFDLAGVRRTREEAARLGVDAARASARDRLRMLRLDVRRAYLDVVLATADLDVARGTLAEIDRILAINRARFEQGELSGIELRRLHVERLRFADDLHSAELARKTAGSTLLALLGLRPLNAAFEAADDLAAPVAAAPASSGAPGDPLAQRPDIEAWRRLEARAEADLRAQHALGKPALVLGAGWQRNFGTNALVLGVTVPLPFFDRNQGGTARADAEQRLVRARADEAATAALLEIEVATLAVEASRARVEYVERDYLRNAREARDIVLASYQAGAATLSDFLDAQRALREAQRVKNRALFDHRISLFQLDAAMGLPMAPSAALE